MPTPTTSHHAAARIPDISVVVRDIVRKGRYELPGQKPMLRVPCDLKPEVPAHYGDEMITYLQGDEVQLGRTAPAPLADAHPGERVLLRLPPSDDENEWWLCEIEHVRP